MLRTSQNACCRLINNRAQSNGIGLFLSKNFSNSNNSSSDKGEPTDLNQIDRELKNIPEKQVFWEYSQTDKGHVYDKKPVKVKCNEGKIYMWCSCGRSKNQPFCDGTHKVAHFKIKLKPIPFKCKESKDYWFCNCKQTNMQPFCDGTHKEDIVQNAVSTIRY